MTDVRLLIISIILITLFSLLNLSSQRENQKVAKDRNSNNIRMRRGSIGGQTDDLSYQFKPSLPFPSEWWPMLISGCIYPGLKEAHDPSSRWQSRRLYPTDSIPRHVPSSKSTGTSTSISIINGTISSISTGISTSLSNESRTSAIAGYSKCHQVCW